MGAGRDTIDQGAAFDGGLEGIEAEQEAAILLRNLEVLDDELVEEMKPRLAELTGERDEVRSSVTQMEQRVAVRERQRDRVASLLSWARAEVERVDAMSAEQKRGVLLELGVVVRVFPRSEPERFIIELGTKLRPSADELFADIDWGAITDPTPAQREETDRLIGEATRRGTESELVAAAVREQGSANGYHPWEYWDLHVCEGVAQHVRVFGLG